MYGVSVWSDELQTSSLWDLFLIAFYFAILKIPFWVILHIQNFFHATIHDLLNTQRLFIRQKFLVCCITLHQIAEVQQLRHTNYDWGDSESLSEMSWSALGTLHTHRHFSLATVILLHVLNLTESNMIL